MSQMEIKIGSKVYKIVKKLLNNMIQLEKKNNISQSSANVTSKFQQCVKKLPNFHRPDQDLSTDTLTRSESQLQFGIMLKKSLCVHCMLFSEQCSLNQPIKVRNSVYHW